MPDMNNPYAYIESVATDMETRATVARAQIERLRTEAETCEGRARQLRRALGRQKAADGELRRGVALVDPGRERAARELAEGDTYVVEPGPSGVGWTDGAFGDSGIIPGEQR